jgi:hypothetical protein
MPLRAPLMSTPLEAKVHGLRYGRLAPCSLPKLTNAEYGLNREQSLRLEARRQDQQRRRGRAGVRKLKRKVARFLTPVSEKSPGNLFETPRIAQELWCQQRRPSGS